MDLYIDGSWTTGSGGTAEVINPYDASAVREVDQAGPAEVDRAVAAAFDGGPWRATSANERGALLRRVADLLVRDKEETALAGWMMLTASIVTIPATALAYQVTLPQLWSGFQVVGDGSGRYDFATNAVILGTALITFTTVVNAIGVKLMARINSTGVARC